ncbi:DUF167 domain-containing protein [Actinokineospora sp. NPDC004072]
MRFRVRVKPGARRPAVGGRHGDALVVAVAAPAVEGKANEAVRRALAATFNLRPRDIEIITGARGRDKIIEIPGNHDELLARLLDQ